MPAQKRFQSADAVPHAVEGRPASGQQAGENGLGVGT